jgi:hypothetical protein
MTRRTELLVLILVIGIAVLCVRCCKCHGASVSVLWNASTDTEVVGYAVYYGTAGTTNRIDVGNVTNEPVNSLQPGFTYFFYVTAYDSAMNENNHSNVILYSVPPAFIPTVVVDQSNEVDGPWYQRFSSPIFPTNTTFLLDSYPLTDAVVSILRVDGKEWWREQSTEPRRFYKVKVTK